MGARGTCVGALKVSVKFGHTVQVVDEFIRWNRQVFWVGEFLSGGYLEVRSSLVNGLLCALLFVLSGTSEE